MSEIRELFETRGESFEIFKFLPPDRIQVWDKSIKSKGDSWTGMGGGCFELIRILKLQDVELEVLKNMKVYSLLSDEVKKELEGHVYIENGDKIELMKKARAARKSKYENMPSELICSVCKVSVEAIPSKIAAECNRKEIMLVDYLSSFKCKKCKNLDKPAKSQKVKLVCKCGKEIIYPISSLDKVLERKGLTLEAYVSSYQCRKCGPPSNFGRDKAEKVDKDNATNATTTSTTTRGRKPNKEFIGLPKRMACIVCGKEVASNLDYLKVKAEKLGVTIKDLIASYKCSTCKKL